MLRTGSGLRCWGLLASLLALVAAPCGLAAQIISPNIGVVLNAQKSTSIRVTITSGAVQTIGSLADGTTTVFPAPVRLDTEWTLNPGLTGSVQLVAYVVNPAAALQSAGGARIPSAQLQGRMTTGLPTTFTAFSGAPVGGVGTPGGTLRLFSQTITGINKDGRRSDALDLRIDRTGQPTLPVGTYTGTIFIRAVTL